MSLLVLRALFGMAMGGEWGVGAALAFESLPEEGRGTFSGFCRKAMHWIHSGLGGIRPALCGIPLARTRDPGIGWRGLFILGSSPALLAFYVQTRVEESPVWLAAANEAQAQAAVQHPAVAAASSAFLPTFLFLVVLMTAFMSFSHGTQDVYPTFLAVQSSFRPKPLASSACSTAYPHRRRIVFGSLSEKWGRKRAIVTAALLAIPVIPLYAYGHSALPSASAQFMQFTTRP